MDVRLGCVNFATTFASEVFLGLSILDSLCTHNSAVKHHVLVNVALAHVANTANRNLLHGRDVDQPYVYPPLDLHEGRYRLILTCLLELGLDSNRALLDKLEELSWVVVEARPLEWKEVQELQ